MSEHTKDSDCTVVDGLCIICHVGHDDPCPDCGGQAFHNPGCWEYEPEPSPMNCDGCNAIMAACTCR